MAKAATTKRTGIKAAKADKSTQPPDQSNSAGASATATAAAPATPARLRTFARFESAVMRRSQLRLAPYNPRVIDPAARRRLRLALKHHGLVEQIVVNRRTGFTVVGGHQRTLLMDEMAGFNADAMQSDHAATIANDYEIPVSIVDVPIAEEQALNIALNNATAHGSYEFGLLEELLTQPDFPVSATGFEKTDLQILLSPDAIASIFGDKSAVAQQAAAEQPIVEQLADIHAAGLAEDRAKAAEQRAAEQRAAEQPPANAAAAPIDQPAAGPSNPGDQQQQPSDASQQAALAPPQSLTDRRAAYIARQRDANDSDFMAIVVFQTSAQLDRFLAALDLDITQRYHDGVDFARRIGVEVEHENEQVEGETEGEST